MSIITTPSENEMSTAIVTRIAEAENASVTDIPPLYDVLGPEHLDSLLESGDVRISFTYCGYRVAVTSEGSITITDKEGNDVNA